MEQATVNILIVVVPLIVGILTWYLNEQSKRSYEEYKRKEERYSALIRSLRGFYIDSLSKELRDEFLHQLNLCWMYCPDEVIRKAYMFLLTVHMGAESSPDEKEEAVGELIVAIRKDLIDRKPLRKTGLTPEDFRHLKAT